MSYLGRSAKLSLKAQEKVSFLATAGQTVKTGLSYTPSFVEVYVNGVLLTDTADFTATNGNSITFTVALLLNDEVTVISLKTFTVADHYNKTEADTLLAAKATNTAVALKAPIASPVFTGNVGIGVTPEGDIVADRPHLRIGSTTALSGSNSNDQTYLSNNAKQVTTAHASGWEYLITDYASQYKQREGTHVFQVAPSGAADAAISWTTPLTITNDGRGLSEFTALCWCSWNMSNSSIKDSYNISSIQDSSVGRQRPIMTNSASDANYAAVANGNAVNNWNGVETTVLGVNTSGPDVYHQESGSTYDPTNVFVICFGG